MASKHYELSGIDSNVEIGKRGPRVKDNSGAVEFRNQADDDFVVVRGADPVAANDFVTKRYMETRASVYVTGQIDGGSPPAAGTPGRVFICTTTGGGYTINYLYWDNGVTWDEIIPAEGQVVSVTDELSGGTVEFTGDHLYLWDADGSTWVDLGPTPAAQEVVKSSRLAFDYADVGVNLIVNVPANAIVTKVILNVTQAWDVNQPYVEVGDAADADRLMQSKGNDLAKVGVQVTDAGYLYGVATDVNVTLSNDGGTPTQGQAIIVVHYDLI
jgi:hypothetical protein